jgi:hypothetical protein
MRKAICLGIICVLSVAAHAAVIGKATVTADQAPVMSGKQVVATAGKGTVFDVTEVKGDWFGVAPSQGWIHKSNVRYEPAPPPGADIVDLIRDRKIEVATQGGGIQGVGLRVRRLVPQPLNVRIPVGTFFASRSGSSQSMVTTREAQTTLTDDGWVSLSVSTACANRPLNIPTAGDTFGIERSPQQAELAKLMPVLDRAGVPYPVMQAAVWIVTDNATYSDLGVLVSRRVPVGGAQFMPPDTGTRVIREFDAARAMQLCQQAGINIKAKAIWRDRAAILQGLQDAALKTWLQQNP